MRKLLTYATVAALALPLLACKKQDDGQQPAQAPTAVAPGPYAAPQAAYPPPQAAAYPPQYTQPAPAPVGYPPPVAAPAPAPGPMAPPAPSGQMAVPGPVAFQCQNDVPCGTHHCNLQYGKCAFPCQTNVDCLAPNSCMMGLCVPAPPQAGQPH
jgi:hypothetical protein